MDIISPTAERVARAQHGIDEPEVTQAVQRRAYIVRDIWSDLHKRSQITATERDAGQKFATHLELAYKGRSITPSYGQRHAEGTPVSQLSGHAAEVDAARVVDYVRLHKAARDILPTTSLLAMLMACEGKTPQQIGNAIGGFKDRNRATVCACAHLKTALELLSSHYSPQRPRGP